MFLELNKDLKPKMPNYFLAKPNQKITANLTSYIYDDNCSFVMGNIHELTFKVPYYINSHGKKSSVYNKDIDKIKEKMLIKMTLGSSSNSNQDVEWFIIDSISDDGESSDYMTITTFSLGFELSHKSIPYYKAEAMSLKEILKEILEDEHSPSIWKIGTIDVKFENIYRSLEINDSNGLAVILEVAETFGALIEWDTINRRVSFLDLESNGSYKGLSVDYGKLLYSFKRERTTDELVTRMNVEGADGISINNYNPTGQSYLEDFTFFLYPFERDVDRNVIRSSDFMSDELCHALLDHSELVEFYAPEFKNLTENRTLLVGREVAESARLTEIEGEIYTIEARLDTAKSLEDEDLISNAESDLAQKNSEYNSQKSLVDSLLESIYNIELQIEALSIQVSKESNFSDELMDELNLYIIEKSFKDDRYTSDFELYNDAIKKFKELRKPKVLITISLENFLEIIEEQYNWDKLVLGDYIKIKYSQMKIAYLARIIEINYNFENGEISLTIANTEKLDENERFKNLLYQTKTATTLLSNNKHKWDKIVAVDDLVWKMLNEEWDANKNKITAGINNQIEIGRRGIIVTNPDFPDEMIIIQSGIIALSQDGGKTWKTAIRPDGIIAERIIGNLIAGRNLVITNSSNSFIIDENGANFLAEKIKFIEDGEEVSFGEYKAGVNSEIESTKAEITATADELRSTISTSVSNILGEISNVQSQITQNSDKISLVVSESNVIKGFEIASSIALTPSAINIISQNIDITGKVTFNSFDNNMKNNFNNLTLSADSAYDLASATNSRIDGWTYTGTTLINGGFIRTGTIAVDKLIAGELYGFSIKTIPNISTGQLTLDGGILRSTSYSNSSMYTEMNNGSFFATNYNSSTTSTQTVGINADYGYEMRSTKNSNTYGRLDVIENESNSSTVIYRLASYGTASRLDVRSEGTMNISSNSTMNITSSNIYLGASWYVSSNNFSHSGTGTTVLTANTITSNNVYSNSHSTVGGNLTVSGTIYMSNSAIVATRPWVSSNFLSSNSGINISGTNMFSIGGNYSTSNPSRPSSLSINSANLYVPSNIYAGTSVQSSGSVLTSDRDLKKNIVKYEKEVLSEIKSLQVYQYHLKEELDTELKHLGVMLQELPIDIISPQGGVELYAMTSFILKGLQELSDKFELLEDRVNKIEDRIN